MSVRKKDPFGYDFPFCAEYIVLTFDYSSMVTGGVFIDHNKLLCVFAYCALIIFDNLSLATRAW